MADNKKPEMGPHLPKTTNPQSFSFLPKIVNGGIAGIVGVSIVFPIDLVKTRMQNQVANAQGVKQYKNIFDCFKQVYAKEGFFGMYRGAAVNILLVTPEKAIKLTANDMFRYYLTIPDGSLPIPRQILAGALAGVLQVVVTTPMDLLKIQMQDAGRIASHSRRGSKKPRNLTAMNISKRLYAKYGIRGLYKGFLITMYRDVAFSAIYFPLYATLADLGVEEIRPGATPPLWWMFMSGIMAGSTAAYLATPMDVVKTRLQTLTKGAGDQTCTSIPDCTIQTYQKEGITAFFKGAGLRLMVIPLLFGIVQTVYYIGIAERMFGLQ